MLRKRLTLKRMLAMRRFGKTDVGPLYYGWFVVWALGLTTIISYGTSQYLFGVLVVPVTDHMGWPRAELSGAYSLGLVVTGLLGLPVGRVLDRFGARLLMTAGSLLLGLSLYGLSRMHALWQFYLFWAGGLGLANALTLYPLSFTVVANWFHRRRGAALALLTLLGGLASPVFIPLAGFLLPRLGWRETVAVMGLCNVLIAAPLHFFVVRRHPEDLGLQPDGQRDEMPVEEARPDAGTPFAVALRQPAFWSLTAALALARMAAMILFVHQVAYLIGLGYAPVAASFVAGTIGLVSLPGRYLLNLLSDRMGGEGLLTLALAAQALGVLFLLGGVSRALLYAYILVFGLGSGATAPLFAGVMAHRFGRQAYGRITAAQGVLVAVCAASGPVAAGWLFDLQGGYGWGLALSASAFALAAAGVWRTGHRDAVDVGHPSVIQ